MKWIELGTTYDIDDAYRDYKMITFFLSNDGVTVAIKMIPFQGQSRTVMTPVARYGSVFDIIRIYGRI